MIKLIVLDVDGTLTDGKITYDNKGNEFKSFNVKDGLGIATWIKLGKKAAIITGRKSQIVENRAKELGITYIKQGISNKANALYEILDQSQIYIDEVAIIGDDLNDLSMFKIAKYTFAPKDSAKEIQKIAHTILSKKGGKGAVREMIDILIKQENLEDKLYEIF